MGKGCLGIFIAVLIVVFIKCCSQAANDYEQAQTREKLEAFQNRPKAQQPAPPAEPAKETSSGMSQEDAENLLTTLVVLNEAMQQQKLLQEQQKMQHQREIEANRVCLHCDGRGYEKEGYHSKHCEWCGGLGYGRGGRFGRLGR